MTRFQIEQHRMIEVDGNNAKRIRIWNGQEFSSDDYKSFSSEKRAMNTASKLCKKGLAFSDEIKITSYEI